MDRIIKLLAHPGLSFVLMVLCYGMYVSCAYYDNVKWAVVWAFGELIFFLTTVVAMNIHYKYKR